MPSATETEIAKAIVVTAEVMGFPIAARAAEYMARELAEHEAGSVAMALRRCAREVTGRLTLAAVLARIDGGHVGPEEAWALCPRDEAQTVVWTDEISEAFGAARLLRADGDEVAARMAFREVYTRLLQRARDEKRAARWWPSLGHDATGRDAALLDAVARGRLPSGAAASLLTGDGVDRLARLPGSPTPIATLLPTVPP